MSEKVRVVNCPTCGKNLKAPESFAGRLSKCPKCGMKVAVPGELAAASNGSSSASPATEHGLL